MAWDDAPPTKAELAKAAWDSAPPTPDELKSLGVAPSNNVASDGNGPTPLQTDLREAAQGFTAGFGDELNGVVGAAGRALGITNLGTVRHLEGGDSLKLASPTLDPGTLAQAYREARDSARTDQAADQKVNPGRTMIAQAAGMLENPLIKDLPPAAAGAAIGLGNSNADLTQGDVGGAVTDTAKGAGMGYLTGALVNKLAPPVASYLSKLAAKQAVKSTGATGATVFNKFSDNAGRELLDNGVVGFGDTQANIASKAADALNESRAGIDNSLSALDEQGANVPQSSIISNLRARAEALSKDPASLDTSDSLNRLADRLESAASGDSSEVAAENAAEGPTQTLSAAEQTKRGFQNKVNYNGSPLDNSVSKEAADVYRQAVEDTATQANPDLAEQFRQAKSDYGTMAPIEEAAAKRAAANEQSQGLNFHGVGRTAIGSLIGGEEGYRHGGWAGAVAGAAGGAFVAPRLASSTAVSTDFVANLVKSAPSSLGKWAPTLIQAAQRGPRSLSATDYVLQSTDDAYRQHIQKLQSNGGNSDVE